MKIHTKKKLTFSSVASSSTSTAVGVGVAMLFSFLDFFLLGSGVTAGTAASISSMSGELSLFFFLSGVFEGVALVVTSAEVLYVCNKGPMASGGYSKNTY